MAYSTQSDFLRANLITEVLLNPKRYRSVTLLASYQSCIDNRAWALNIKDQAQYLSDIIRTSSGPEAICGSDGQTEKGAAEIGDEVDFQYTEEELKGMTNECLIVLIINLYKKSDLTHCETVELEKLLQDALSKLEEYQKIIDEGEAVISKQLKVHRENRQSVKLKNQSTMCNCRDSSFSANKSQTSSCPSFDPEKMDFLEKRILMLKEQASKADTLEKENKMLECMCQQNEESLKLSEREKEMFVKAQTEKSEALCKCMEMMNYMKKQCSDQQSRINCLCCELKKAQTNLCESEKCCISLKNDIKDYVRSIVFMGEQIEKLKLSLQLGEDQLKQIDDLKRLGKLMYCKLSCAIAGPQVDCKNSKEMDEHVRNLKCAVKQTLDCMQGFVEKGSVTEITDDSDGGFKRKYDENPERSRKGRWEQSHVRSDSPASKSSSMSKGRSSLAKSNKSSPRSTVSIKEPSSESMRTKSSDSPRKKSSGSPRKSTSGSPRKSTPGSPRKSTPSSPRKSTPGSARKSTLDSPRKKTLDSPRKSTPDSPRNKTSRKSLSSRSTVGNEILMKTVKSVSSIKQTLIETKDLLDSSKSHILLELSEVKHVNEELTNYIEEIQATISEKDDLIAELQQEKSQLYDNFTKGQDFIKVLKESLGDLQSKQSMLGEENQFLNEQLDQLSELVDEIETEKAKNKEIECELSVFENRLSNLKLVPIKPSISKTNASGTIRELSKMLDDEQKESNMLRMSIASCESKIRSLEQQLFEFSEQSKKGSMSSNSFKQLDAKHLTEKIQHISKENLRLLKDLRDTHTEIPSIIENTLVDKLDEIETHIITAMHNMKKAHSFELQTVKIENEIENRKIRQSNTELTMTNTKLKKKKEKLSKKLLKCTCENNNNCKLEHNRRLRGLCLKIIDQGIDSLSLTELSEMHGVIYEAGYKRKFEQNGIIGRTQNAFSLKEKEQIKKISQLEQELQLSKMVLENLKQVRSGVSQSQRCGDCDRAVNFAENENFKKQSEKMDAGDTLSLSLSSPSLHLNDMEIEVDFAKKRHYVRQTKTTCRPKTN